ncbi:MAG: ribonuclease D [Candidatus Competibacterales bacterium]
MTDSGDTPAATAVEPRYVATFAELTATVQALAQGPWIALDTEFVRDQSYYPVLCLIQVANPQGVACIDPFALDDLSPLVALLANPEVTKIVHAAGQDLEVLYHNLRVLPQGLFDTQIAAALLGYGDAVGYAPLVEATLGVTLDKSQTRTDWQQRPLNSAQLCYAVADVYYLGALYQLLQRALVAQGRAGWAAEEVAALLRRERFVVCPQQAWRRVRGLHRLKGPGLAALRGLAAWREAEAMAQDRPRRWIVGDDTLVELAWRRPENRSQLKGLRRLNPGVVGRYGAALLAVLEAARQCSPEDWPQNPTPQPLTPRQGAAVEAALDTVRQRAQALGISPERLARRRELERWVTGDRADDIPLFTGWRRAVAGEAVLAQLTAGLASSGDGDTTGIDNCSDFINVEGKGRCP